MMLKNRKGFTLIELMIVVTIIGILAAALTGGSGSVGLYGYFNSKMVSGQLESVTSALPEGVFVGYGIGTQVFQASVIIKEGDGSYTTFSTDDRQWASFTGNAAKGKCVTAKVFPYVP